MRVLLADDDHLSRHLFQNALVEWGYEAIPVDTGNQAWEVLQQPDAPKIALLDWMMPGLDGVDVCRRVRSLKAQEPPYLLLVTSRNLMEDLVAALEAGANDYVTKPFEPAEMRARLLVAGRTVELQRQLAQQIHQLQDALAHVRQLRELLPMCAWCNKIRDDQNYWQRLEVYLSKQFDTRITHGICPECMRQLQTQMKTTAAP